MNVTPASSTAVGTKFRTPAGKPISSNTAVSNASVSGVCAAGLTMQVHPAARAAPIFRVAIANGKFHGVRRCGYASVDEEFEPGLVGGVDARAAS
jgi:hypothetical protein